MSNATAETVGRHLLPLGEDLLLPLHHRYSQNGASHRASTGAVHDYGPRVARRRLHAADAQLCGRGKPRVPSITQLGLDLLHAALVSTRSGSVDRRAMVRAPAEQLDAPIAGQRWRRSELRTSFYDWWWARGHHRPTTSSCGCVFGRRRVHPRPNTFDDQHGRRWRLVRGLQRPERGP